MELARKMFFRAPSSPSAVSSAGLPEVSDTISFSALESKKLEHGCRMYAGCPCFLGVGGAGNHVPTFWPLP